MTKVLVELVYISNSILKIIQALAGIIYNHKMYNTEKMF